MWLVDVNTYQLVYFANPPSVYAILSHTWRDEEILFQDMQRRERATEQKQGWRKVQYTCDQARKNRYQYVWIDTCCIDKSSSAELSEAINSMFEWYSCASCCYAYLDDYAVPEGAAVGDVPGKDALAQCQWFYRGWTLQELIASPTIVFYGSGWTQIGTKETLQGLLSSITGVDEDVLENPEHRHAVAVARRMCWAAHRETTRGEDIAYCLLGIFDVNMPLLYGEGGVKAFERLQREIARRQCDASLLAWTQDGQAPWYRGVLARAPAEFALCSKMASCADIFFARNRLSFTDSGELVIYPREKGAEETRERSVASQAWPLLEAQGLELTQVFNYMGMERGSHGASARVGILLHRFGDIYVRFRPDILEDPARFTTCFESSPSSPVSAAAPRHTVAATLGLSHLSFMMLLAQQRLFLLYRRRLIRNLTEFNGGPPQPTSLSTLGSDAREMLDANRIDASHCPLILREFRLNTSSAGEPLWWDNMVVMLGDGEGSVNVRVSVVCGIPARPHGSFNRALPWFAIFCDRGTCRSETGHSNGEVEALLVKQLHSAVASRDTQRYVSDVIFENYADATGSVAQEKVPIVVMVRDKARTLHEIRVNRLGGGLEKTHSADVQFITRGAVESQSQSPASPRRTFQSFRSERNRPSIAGVLDAAL